MARYGSRARRSGRISATAPAAGRAGRSVFWRRRFAVALVLAVLGVGTVEVIGWGAGLVATRRSAPSVTASARVGPAPSLPAVYVVEPGDTLWSIAGRLDPRGDPRPLVDRLVERAGGAAIRPGQRLRLEGLP